MAGLTGTWDERHAAAGRAVAAPPEALALCAGSDVPAGPVLDVACGRGGVVAWARGEGRQVVGVDRSAVALALTAELLTAGVVTTGLETAGPGVLLVRADVERGPGVPFHPTPRFALVVCQRFWVPGLLEQLAAFLVPGGVLATSALSEVGSQPGRFRVPAGGLDAALRHAGLSVVASHEGDGLARTVARRPC